MKKKCSKCRIFKKLSDFGNDKLSKDNKQHYCKKCNSERVKIFYKKFPWKRVYHDAKRRCDDKKFIQFKDYGGRGIKCLIAAEELKHLWFRDKAYEMKRPSIDRIDNNGNYEFNNCRFIELSKNISLRNINVCSKPILQHDLNGIFIREWKSAREIKRKLGFNQGNISSVCLGKYKQSYGFIWRFKNG